MAKIKTAYTGSLGTSTTYPLSDEPILTKAKPFGPTDLLTASLGSCIATYIDLVAQRNNFERPNTIVEVTKTMNVDSTKVTAFDIDVSFGNEYAAEQKEIIEKTAQTCPVGNSLAGDISRTYSFNY